MFSLLHVNRGLLQVWIEVPISGKCDQAPAFICFLFCYKSSSLGFIKPALLSLFCLVLNVISGALAPSKWGCQYVLDFLPGDQVPASPLSRVGAVYSPQN